MPTNPSGPAERRSSPRSGVPSWSVTAAKVGAIVAALALVPWQASIERLHYFLTVDRYLQAAAFLVLTAICVAGFVVTPFLRAAWLRVPLVLLAVGGYAADQIAAALSGQHLDEVWIATLWREKAEVASVAPAYLRQAIGATWWLLPLALVLAWPPTPRTAARFVWAACPLAALLGIVIVAHLTASGTAGFPAAYRVPAVTAVTALSGRYDGPREPIGNAAHAQPHYSKIVMIVDESVRGDFLGITDPARNTTPFLSGLRTGLINYGIATAAHNCSAPSRLILRTGLQAADLPDREQRALKMPTVWQFAQQAGYETVLIDAFAHVFNTHSFMSPQELSFVQKTIPVSDTPVYLRDRRIAAELLPGLLAGQSRRFIYVNKYGAHFPYQYSHPPDFPAPGIETKDDLDNREALAASYRRAVRWSVDEFFRELLSRVDLVDTLILYTSDHGQSLLEGGYKLPHCSTGNVHPGEGIVPLLAFANDAGFGTRLKASAAEQYGRASHFQIVPTLLLAMGYEPSWVAARFGDGSLLRKPSTAQRRFLTGNMFGAGLGTKWIDVR